MHIERASDDVYVFTSERYAQVTATLIVSGTVGVMIDTLPFPTETAQIARLAQKVAPDGVRYLIYTQHQADHVYGSVFFPRAEIIAHAVCRQMMVEHGYQSLESARQSSPEFDIVRLRLPTVTFDTGTFSLRLPNKTLDMIATPGHTPDSISVLLQEEKILFAGDTVMALPTITDGDPSQLKASLAMIGDMPLDSIVQGHGEIILKGEIRDYLRKSLNYLDQLETRVHRVIEEGGTKADARALITLESCGMPRVLLNGQVTGLHAANVAALHDRYSIGRPAAAKPVVEPKPVAPARGQATSPKADKAKPAETSAARTGGEVASSGKAGKPAARTPVAPAAKPAAKPIKPVGKPVAKPVKPAAKPAAKPAKPAGKPAKPASKPAKPVAKPAQPAVRQGGSKARAATKSGSKRTR